MALLLLVEDVDVGSASSKEVVVDGATGIPEEEDDEDPLLEGEDECAKGRATKKRI